MEQVAGILALFSLGMLIGLLVGYRNGYLAGKESKQ